MEVLFTSAGSIGSRHIKNLSAICSDMGAPLIIDVVRKTDRILPDDIKSLISHEIRDDSELRDSYDIGFITDETKTHFDNISKYRSRCKHLFIEKPIFESTDYDIMSIAPTGDSVYYVACPIRFSKYYEELKKVVDSQDVYSARVIFSSYMPNWQKGRDYRKSFRCFKERGGGVDIDSLHEIDYVTSLFGIPTAVKRVAGKYSNLEMDAPDLATYIFEYSDKLIEVHLDYFGRTNNRRVEFFTKDDVIVVDYNKHTVEYQLESKSADYGIDDQFYQNEMKYFIKLTESKGSIENINPICNAFESLRIAKGK